jgi:tetratricopeptide (TPR) repeat protein
LILLALPLVVFGTCGAYRAELEIPVRSAIVSVLPGVGDQQLKLGAAYQRQRDFAAAETAYRAAIVTDPSWAIAHHNLGLVLGRQARLGDAEASFRRALELEPKLRPSAVALGNLLIAQRRRDEAEEVIRSALAPAPDAPELKNLLARALLAGSPDEAQVAEAVRQASEAVRQTRFRNANPLVTLAHALAAQQRFNRAVRLLERAEQMESVRQNPVLARQIDRDLRDYRAFRRKPD